MSVPLDVKLDGCGTAQVLGRDLEPQVLLEDFLEGDGELLFQQFRDIFEEFLAKLIQRAADFVFEGEVVLRLAEDDLLPALVAEIRVAFALQLIEAGAGGGEVWGG